MNKLFIKPCAFLKLQLIPTAYITTRCSVKLLENVQANGHKRLDLAKTYRPFPQQPAPSFPEWVSRADRGCKWVRSLLTFDKPPFNYAKRPQPPSKKKRKENPALQPLYHHGRGIRACDGSQVLLMSGRGTGFQSCVGLPLSCAKGDWIERVDSGSRISST